MNSIFPLVICFKLCNINKTYSNLQKYFLSFLWAKCYRLCGYRFCGRSFYRFCGRSEFSLKWRISIVKQLTVQPRTRRASGDDFTRRTRRLYETDSTKFDADFSSFERRVFEFRNRVFEFQTTSFRVSKAEFSSFNAEFQKVVARGMRRLFELIKSFEIKCKQDFRME